MTAAAAFRIGGNTLHSMLKLPIGNKDLELSDSKREIIRENFKNVKVLIIDEFGMMGKIRFL